MTSERWSRRRFLQLGAAASLVPLHRLARAQPPRAPAFVFLCLEGGLDALSVWAPVTDPAYHRLRPNTAVATGPRFDEYVLHPGLSALERYVRAGQLKLVVGAGIPGACSHGVALRTLYQTLRGISGGTVVRARIAAQSGSTHGAVRAPYPETALGDALAAVASERNCRLDSPNTLIRVSGFDTHVAQGDAMRGRLPDALEAVGQALAAFARDMSQMDQHVVVVVMSEFGRSVRENRMGGTDDGSGGIAMVLDLRERAPKLPRWPSLGGSSGLGLPITTDLRDMLRELASRSRSRCT